MSLITVSREGFRGRYDKQKTRNMIDTALWRWDTFLKHIQTTEADIMLRFKQNEREKYAILDHMVQTWKRAIAVKSMRDYFQYIKTWLKYNEIQFDDDKIKEHIRFPKQIRSRTRGVDKDVFKKLIDASNPFYKALIITCCATGIRVNGVLNMRVNWIDFNSKPAKITVPGEFAKMGIEYITFLTPEAERMIKDLIKERNLKEDDIIFNRTYGSFATYIHKLRKKLYLTDKEPNGKFNIVRIHKCRSFTLNRLSRGVGSEFAHAMLGHGESVGKYFHDGMSDDEAAQDFMQGVNYLTINEEVKLRDENQNLKAQIAKQNQLEEKVAKLEAALYAKKLKHKKKG